MPEEPKNEATPQENDVVSDAPTDEVHVSETVAPEGTPEALVATPLESPTSPEVIASSSVVNTSQEPQTETPPAEPNPVVASAIFGSAPLDVSAPETPPKKTKKPLIIGLIVAGAAALLIGGSALAYNFWYQNPNKVVTDAIVNAVTAKTLSATGVFEIEANDYKLKVEASGKNSLEAHSNVAVKLTFTSDDVNYVVDGEGIYSAEGDIYVKLNDAKKLATSIEEQSNGQLSFEAFDGVIKKIDSKWIKIGKEDLGDFSEEYEKSQKCVAGISKQLEEDSSFRKSVENETKKLYQEHPFIIVGDKIGSRTISGQGSLGYKLTGDAKAADEFFTSFGDSQLGKKFKECNDDIKFDEFVDATEEKENDVKTQAEIWVSRFGHVITEVNVKIEDDEAKGSLVFNPIFNKNEKVEIPGEFVPFSELQSDIEKAYEEYYESYYDGYNYQSSMSSTEFN